MANEDLKLNIILSALDYASQDIEGVNAKVKELAASLNESEYEKASRGLNEFGESVKSTTDPLADAATKSIALSAAITGVASALAGKVYQSAVSYESAMAGLAKVSAGGAEEAKRYGEQLDKLAIQYGQNGQALVESMTNFVQAGYDSQDAFRLVEESVKLMIAGELEAGEASANLISILKGFNAPASEAANAVDLLNEVSNNYATNVKELADGMAGISPIASKMGFTMDETAGLLVPIIEVFRSGSEAADGLKTGLQKLTDDSAPVVDALGKLGVSQLDVNESMRQGKDIMREGKDIFYDVAKALQGMDAAQQQVIVSQIVGIDQAARMSLVFADLAKVQDVNATAAGKTGSAMKEVEVRLQTSQIQADRAEESFRQLSVTLGKTVQPEITGVIAATGNMAAAFNHAVEAGDLDPLINALTPQIQAVSDLFDSIADNLEVALQNVDWTPLVDGLKEFSGEFGEAFSALFDGIDPRSAEGLQALLQALINQLGQFTEFVAGVVDGLGPFMDTLNAVFKAIANGSPEIANLAGQLTGLATTANLVIPVVANIGSTIFGAIGAVVSFAAKVGLAVAALKLLNAAGVPVGAMFRALISVIAGMFPTLATATLRFTGLSAVLKTLGVSAALIGGYQVGKALNEWGLAAGYAAEKGSIAALAFERLTTAGERAEMHFSEVSGKIAEKFREISDATGVTVMSMRELDREIEAGTIVFNEATGAWERGVSVAEKRAAAVKQATESDKLQREVADALKASMADLGLEYDTATGKVKKYAGTGIYSAKQVEAAFKQLGITSTASLEKQAADAKQSYRIISDSGTASAADIEAAWQAYVKAAEAAGLETGRLSKPVGDLASAFETLGIKSSLDLQKQADEAKAAYEAIRDSGTASAADIAAAQTAWQQAATAAAGGVDTLSQSVTSLDSGIKSATPSHQQWMQSLGDYQLYQDGAISAEEYGNRVSALTDTTEDAADAQGDLADSTEDSTEATEDATDANDDNARSSHTSATANQFLSGELQKAGVAAEHMAAATEASTAAYAEAAAETAKWVDALAESWVGKGWTTGGAAALLFADKYIERLQAQEKAAIAAGKAAAEHAAALERYSESMANLDRAYQDGDISLAQYIRSMERAAGAASALGDEELRALRAAIADAKAEMDDFTASAKDGLASLQQEWAELNGQQMDALQIEQQQERLEIEQQIADAREMGNAEAGRTLQQQLTLLDQIQAKERDQLATEIAQEAEREAAAHKQSADEIDRMASTLSDIDAGASVDINNNTSSSATRTIETRNVNVNETVVTHRLEIDTAKLFGDERAVNDFISALERAGLRVE